MSADPVATAASNNPLLSTLGTAVKKAGLVDTLNNAPNITVCAPTNDAFGQIDKLTRALVAPDKATPDKLASLDKLQGVSVQGSGEQFTVNGNANVLGGNVQTANATVYIIDHVLLPKS